MTKSLLRCEFLAAAGAAAVVMPAASPISAAASAFAAPAAALARALRASLAVSAGLAMLRSLVLVARLRPRVTLATGVPRTPTDTASG